MLTVAFRALGTRLPLLPNVQISSKLLQLMPESDGVPSQSSLTELLRAVVEQSRRQLIPESADGRAAQHPSAAAAPVLTAMTGMTRSARQTGWQSRIGRKNRSTACSVANELAALLTALERGDYFVVVDDVDHQRPEEPVELNPDSRVTLIRTIRLSGG